MANDTNDNDQDPVKVLPSGGVKFEDTRLTDERVGQIIMALAQAGRLVEHLRNLGRASDLAALCATLLDCDQKNDLTGMNQAASPATSTAATAWSPRRPSPPARTRPS